MSEAGNKDLIRLAVADDDTGICELLCNHINTLENCKVVIQASGGKELLDKLKAKPNIDIVILDIMMDEMDGYTAAGIIRKEYPAMRILFYSMCKNEIALSMMIASGGHGLIKKGESCSQVQQAIRTVMEGYYFFPGTGKRTLVSGDDYKKGKENTKSILSQEEATFLRLVGTNMTYDEIAARMKVKHRQIDYIRENLFKRLKAKSRPELAILAFKGGLFPIKNS